VSELDEVIREVDQLADRGDWEGLLALRDRCRAAQQRGKQFWPAASYAEYRMALDAPGPYAAAIVAEPGTGRFALGPLTEVAAVNHEWSEIAGPGPQLAIAGHERVLRGEDLRRDTVIERYVLELPLVLQRWEPAYPTAVYKPDKAEFPTPPIPDMKGDPQRVEPAWTVDDAEATRALTDLAAAWTTESNGRAEAVAVEGDAAGAVAALGAPAVRLSPMSAADALAWMAWTAASGGAHGRRRGLATGRFSAWWTIAAIAGVADEWPLTPDEIGTIATSELHWFAWDAGEPETGWGLRIAVEDPADGRAWALIAADAA
jgi:hypothetical protein